MSVFNLSNSDYHGVHMVCYRVAQGSSRRSRMPGYSSTRSTRYHRKFQPKQSSAFGNFFRNTTEHRLHSKRLLIFHCKTPNLCQSYFQVNPGSAIRETSPTSRGFLENNCENGLLSFILIALPITIIVLLLGVHFIKPNIYTPYKIKSQEKKEWPFSKYRYLHITNPAGNRY